MSITTISTQQLRKELPRIRRGLKRGRHYLLIHRSQPIAELKPLKNVHETAHFLKMVTHPSALVKFRSKTSAVDLVRLERS